ncbi:acetyltransferase [Candidatus Thioglobus sp.]|nr:acetyltransferase [Candidatus Thioglobus sp.]
MKRLAIFGASGHGKVVAEIAELNGWSDIVFYDDDLNRKNLEKWMIKGDIKMLISDFEEFNGFIVAIGNNKIREEKTKYILSAGVINLVSLKHPSSILSKYSEIGLGSVIMAGCVINPYCKIGGGVIINTNSIVEHDNLIQDYVHISPGACVAGGVNIGRLSWVGIGASIKQNIVIGSNVTIGAGSVVIENIDNNSTVFGVPAKKNIEKC